MRLGFYQPLKDCIIGGSADAPTASGVTGAELVGKKLLAGVLSGMFALQLFGVMRPFYICVTPIHESLV